MVAVRTLRHNRTGAATRQKIIDAAIAVLADKGFAGFTLQAVADRAGVHFGSVTHHYRTRDMLIEAMLGAILQGYRARFVELVALVRAGDKSPVRALVTWLIDDAVDPFTAGIFLELWAMASHLPAVAKAVNQVYDDAIEAFIDALGIRRHSASTRRLRDALYVLGTVVEGTSALFSNRDRGARPWRAFRREAIDLLVPFIEQRVAEAAERSSAQSASRGGDQNRRRPVSRA